MSYAFTFPFCVIVTVSASLVTVLTSILSVGILSAMKQEEVLLSFDRLLLSLFLVVCYFLPIEGFTWGGSLGGHVFYMLGHVNIFHLMANILCLVVIRCPLRLFESLLCAFICSYLPCFTHEETLGFSGVLFAMVGISWGRVNRFKEMFTRNWFWILLPLIIPHVNGFLHLYCLLLGYFLGYEERDKGVNQ